MKPMSQSLSCFALTARACLLVMQHFLPQISLSTGDACFLQIIAEGLYLPFRSKTTAPVGMS